MHKAKFFARVAVVIVAVGFLAVGIIRKEPETVFNKAANICMECIGLG